MPWITTNQAKLPFPAAVWSKISREEKIDRKDVMEALRETQKIHNEAVYLSTRVNELEAEVLRLKLENEFMLRLIEK